MTTTRSSSIRLSRRSIWQRRCARSSIPSTQGIKPAKAWITNCMLDSVVQLPLFEEQLDKYAKRSAKLPERPVRFMTTSSEPLARLYTPEDFGESEYLDKLGFPGEWPYTRGVHATGHSGKLWTMRMFAGFGNAEETNE